jgi:predicted ATP-grasp superfamily ATP-dependent carboligase
MDVSGIAVARSLGRRGITVWALDASADRWSLHSRYCQRMGIPSLTEGDGPLLEAMLGLGRRLGDAVLYGLHDDYVAFIARNREQLQRWYRITHAHRSAVETVIDKRRLATLCQQAGIPIPRTWVPRGEDEVRAISREAPFPCLLKPAYSRSWRTPAAERVVRGAKTVRVGSPEELVGEWQRLSQLGCPLLVQELIPGPDHNLYTCSGYYGQDAAPLAQLVGRKFRTLPVHFGVATLLESVFQPEVASLARRLARALNYRGNLGAEFKLDPRDGRFKLIESNARFVLWAGFAGDCGVDLAYCAYRDAIGAPVSFRGPYPTGVRWLHPKWDLHAVIEMRKRRELGLADWLRSLTRVRSLAGFAWDDPVPFVHYCVDIARGLARRAGYRTGRSAVGSAPRHARPAFTPSPYSRIGSVAVKPRPMTRQWGRRRDG